MIASTYDPMTQRPRLKNKNQRKSPKQQPIKNPASVLAFVIIRESLTKSHDLQSGVRFLSQNGEIEQDNFSLDFP